MLRAEFHCHTSFSKDCLTSPEILVEACRRKGIDRVVVTDHNTIAGARLAQNLDPGRVIIGEEIMTAEGELLAAFVSSEVPPGLTPFESITLLRQQGAFISVSHPFDSDRKGGWDLKALLDIAPQVDAIEVFNSRCMRPAFNDQAASFARQHGLAGTVGSDAHTVWEMGRSVLLLEAFNDATSLRQVLREAASETRWSPPWIHLTSRYARLRKWLRIGLDTA